MFHNHYELLQMQKRSHRGRQLRWKSLLPQAFSGANGAQSKKKHQSEHRPSPQQRAHTFDDGSSEFELTKYFLEKIFCAAMDTDASIAGAAMCR